MTSDSPASTITMFGAEWCRDCRRTKAQLDDLGVEYTYVDLEADPSAAEVAREISGRTIELGENVGPGAPLFTIVDLDQAWFTFNLREDLLAGLAMGDRLTIRIPALDTETEAEITLINVQGQFASWRATRATGDFDLRSFELRARPVAPLEGLRPGMSALIQLDR